MSEIALPLQLGEKNYNRESSSEKFISEISRTTFFFAIVQGTRSRNDRIESNENETSNLRGRLTKTEQECNE